ncbi:MULTISPECIES: hypothetical protein [Flavobacterium]|jgi:hypothetical protein|uniref:YceI family protein n=1 Tax=Flavobacterium cupriresistens TaxID=2893885 RepID=A0ABU4RBQ5_9FLAO|nr:MULTISPECIES: hypothetical protein [unclassified Flavobacterium]KLT69869.1 hypothetical protein AB674_09165 [Flavobacterium sp. ABG]MDX6189686.1 hypothetical protein [Flavobacterium sp. Fl-318]UFH40908.1 hypothetical protein LNP23_13940 [Flavobacterium sp. F-323]
MRKLVIIVMLGLVSFLVLGSARPTFYPDDTILIIKMIEIKISGKSTIGDYNCDNSLLKKDTIFLNLNKRNNIVAEIPMLRFDCRHRIMTKDFQTTVKVKKYPTSSVTIYDIRTYGKNYKCNLSFLITDKTFKYKDIILNTSGNKIEGIINLSFSEIGLEPPVRMAGLVKVKDEIQIDFFLHKN